ncbi:uncharacterized protein DUF4293 [Neolewinella xylanilytica]|uniref:Uncharacterized protein DUF4293 n=1 Tax=Neolewinella xylanilytica TaxID=1514080 RepID=A0A2S6I3Q3_9BACT|nr:DUF4293 domain-containing protein [Neolewinella xylanilytica]PPK85818.1 uncharacterized protein DUF4293 [Neolewinella xylanilytica]
MIQRIQSIFLALAAICSFGLFGTDVAETAAPVVSSEVFADAQFDVYDSPILIGGVIGAGIVLFLAIFLFRNRKLQMNLCYVGIFLTMAYAIYGALLWIQDTAAEEAGVEPGVTLPILAVLFSVLASRYIRKDEKLVRSADRLR